MSRITSQAGIKVPDGVLYSPRPPLDYTRQDAELGRVGIGLELMDAGLRPQWNLYWLSDPALDCFLGGDRVWSVAGDLDMKMLAACYATVEQKLARRHVKELLLQVTPLEFAALVEKNPHKHLYTYRLRKSRWLTTISERALLFRGAVFSDGKVIQVNFARKNIDEKVDRPPVGSATIMTLSLRKTD